MEPSILLPRLLGLAWLLPLGSFAWIALAPRRLKQGRKAGGVATAAILAGFALSAIALGVWLTQHPLAAAPHEGPPGAAEEAHAASPAQIAPVTGDWYALASVGTVPLGRNREPLRLSIGYYIDSLTVAMFFMVTLVASCIHVYSFGYMHEELHEVTDPLAPQADGQPVRRPGRFHRFYQYLSLFCFSMLGLVVAGNVLMVFMFWELVGICSYLLIGFYTERRSATNAANKAFIVNRVGDFGMIVGLAALWSGLGTFQFAEIFREVRPAERGHALFVPNDMVRAAAASEIEHVWLAAPNARAAEAQVQSRMPLWRQQGYGYGLLVIVGLGVFCGCVGKSAQFPLHVWLPDAMEGPTPVSALIHAATMVAAGVYLTGRFFPVFTPEVLLVIACTGCITLFIAATIAITATDIKRVLAYSTVSQLGYMMLALGVGGWVAGLFHLFTHAFFKALLFLGSGSVIHACGTNEMPQMGGLRKKMPWTAYTMLAGCLAISGAGVPLWIGFSGFHSKDAMLAQLFSFARANPRYGWLFIVAAVMAAATSLYMFRLWYLTFAGRPRDEHVSHHAHESPRIMVAPLVLLAVLAVISGWWLVPALLEQARPAGTLGEAPLPPIAAPIVVPAESASHQPAIHGAVSWIAFVAALVGFLVATAFYGRPVLDPDRVRRRLAPLYWFFKNKWWFDEVYRFLFVRPVLRIAAAVADLDTKGIDWLADNCAVLARRISRLDDLVDRLLVDGLVNGLARWFYGLGLLLRRVQTGRLRQYVLRVALGTVALFVLVSLYWSLTER
jgi:NADH-quinone oxidoreductase subunit L